jgi:hypothetical protein
MKASVMSVPIMLRRREGGVFHHAAKSALLLVVLSLLVAPGEQKQHPRLSYGLSAARIGGQ